MKIFLSAILLSSLALPALAQTEDQPDTQDAARAAAACTAADGQYLTGVVTKKPYYVAASETLQGIQLSHTHVTIQGDSNKKSYDVAIDNVFNSTWTKNSTKIPTNLASVTIGTHLSLCGLLYTSGSPGIHWVHDSCGDTSSSNPNGWTEIIASNGTVGANLEASQTYCYLFN